MFEELIEAYWAHCASAIDVWTAWVRLCTPKPPPVLSRAARSIEGVHVSRGIHRVISVRITPKARA